MKKLKVLVLCGGKSAEHQVSLVSAKTILDNLDRRRFDPQPVFIDLKGRWFKGVAAGSRALSAAERLAPSGAPADVVFPVLHGPMGEDGTMQGFLELAGLPYVGSGVLGSALGMDKEFSKRLAVAAGLPVLPFVCITDPAQARAAVKTLRYPLFVKPARLGSSVGISKVKTPAQLTPAVRQALRYDDKVIIEQGISAREIECAVLGDPWTTKAADPLSLRASVVGEIVPKASFEFYDYESKYLDPEGAALHIPARLPAAAARQVQTLALKAFKLLDGYGMARVDFLMDKETGALFFNEINTIPGFTSTSMYPLLWRASGVETPKLLSLLIDLALRRHGRRAALKTTPADARTFRP